MPSTRIISLVLSLSLVTQFAWGHDKEPNDKKVNQDAQEAATTSPEGRPIEEKQSKEKAQEIVTRSGKILLYSAKVQQESNDAIDAYAKKKGINLKEFEPFRMPLVYAEFLKEEKNVSSNVLLGILQGCVFPRMASASPTFDVWFPKGDRETVLKNTKDILAEVVKKLDLTEQYEMKDVTREDAENLLISIFAGKPGTVTSPSKDNK